jgi:hypothetical protein
LSRNIDLPATAPDHDMRVERLSAKPPLEQAFRLQSLDPGFLSHRSSLKSPRPFCAGR